MQASNSLSASCARPCASRKRPRAAGISTVPTPAGKALMRQEIKQRLRFIELAAGDCDLRKYRRGEGQSAREVPVLRDAQRDARGGVRLRQIAKLELQQRSRAVDRDEAARAAGTVGLAAQRHERGFDRAESLRCQQAPQQRGAHVPAFHVALAPASAASRGRAASSAGRPVRMATMPCAKARAVAWSSRELAARQAFHHAQGARRGAGVLQTYGDQLAFQLNCHRHPACRRVRSQAPRPRRSNGTALHEPAQVPTPVARDRLCPQ